jgi:hypothetical protein
MLFLSQSAPPVPLSVRWRPLELTSVVSLLFRRCRPAHIAGLVVAVRVDAIQGLALGSYAQVGEERRE